ncbi:MAG: ribonuclease HII [Halioglobus sp.]|nr:ribonuclease HII [Halioglobus sp.]
MTHGTGDALVAGIDEAGRGPLAGPVLAAAVILDWRRPIRGLEDSKKLSAARREALAIEIRRSSLAWSVARADAAEIDSLNIFQATLLAMRRAILGLRVWPLGVEVDGLHLPDLRFQGILIGGRAIVGGDATVAAISAASILAKVDRDRMMTRLDRAFPQYGFARHKGYGTREHRDSLMKYGPCPQHRRSFRPLSDML